jgi:hypothetical protein
VNQIFPGWCLNDFDLCSILYQAMAIIWKACDKGREEGFKIKIKIINQQFYFISNKTNL